MTFRPKILVFLEFQFLRSRANFGVYFMLEALFAMQSLFLVEKMLENLCVSVEIGILKELKFSGGKLWPYSTGLLSYDLTALGFFIINFLHGIVNITLVHGSLFSFLFFSKNTQWWKKGKGKQFRLVYFITYMPAHILKMWAENRQFSCKKQDFFKAQKR